MQYLPINNKQEELLYNSNKRITQYEQWKQEAIANNESGPHYDRWIENIKSESKIGNDYSIDLAAPGCGKIHYIITKVNDNGDVFGECTSDFICVLEECDVI